MNTDRIDVKKFGKVAVLMGGDSAERPISLKSGTAVTNALKNAGVDVTALDLEALDASLLSKLESFDRVFIALHGRGGEDGTIQGFLRTIGMPFTGSDVMGSAIAMDKVRTKQLWQGAGIPTAPFKVLTKADDLVGLETTLGFPIMMKPSREGSSIGMSKVTDQTGLSKAFEVAAQLDNEILAEKWIQGSEYTVGILGNTALPLIRMETPRDFYDYEAKYQANTTQYHCPCGLDQKVEAEIQAAALRAFDIVGCSGWGRVDLMMDEQNRYYFLEVNTVPGMTDHSLVPMAAKAAGNDFEELVVKIVALSMDE